jgi:thioredoxin 1
MSQKNNRSKQSLRPMLVAFGVIAVSVFGLMMIDRGNSTGNSSNGASIIADNSETGMPAVSTDASAAAEGKVQILTTSNFEHMVSDGVVLVDFWATWCPPCRIQGPIVEDLAKDMGNRAVISKLDVDDHGSIAALYQVRSIPTLIIFRNGEPVRRFVGVQEKETLAQAIQELL